MHDEAKYESRLFYQKRLLSGEVVTRCHLGQGVLEQTRLPKILWDAHHNQLPEDVREMLAQWLVHWEGLDAFPDKGLYISGGEMADIAMAVALKGVRRRGRSALCISALEFVDFVEEKSNWNRVMEASCLAIPDFGLQYRDAKGFVDSHFIKLLIGRARAALPTVLVTQLGFGAFQSEMAEYSELVCKSYVEIPCRST